MGIFDNFKVTAGHSVEDTEEMEEKARRKAKEAWDGGARINSDGFDNEAIRADEEQIHADNIAAENNRLLKSGEVVLAGGAPEVRPQEMPMVPQPAIAPAPRRSGGGGGSLIREGRSMQSEGREQIDASREGQKGAMARQQEAIDAGTEARSQLAEERREALAQTEDDESAAREALQEAREELEPEREAAEARANAEVDSDRFWKNLTAGDKAQIGVANIFSAVGAGLMAAGGGGYIGNTAARAVEKRVQRDIEAQKENIRNGMAQLERVDRKDSKLYGELQDSLNRSDAAYQRALQVNAQAARDEAARTDDALKREQLTITANTLDEKAGQELEARGMQKEAQGQRRNAQAAAARQRAEAAKMKALEMMQKQRAQDDEARRKISVRGLEHDGQTYVTEKAAEEIRKKKASAQVAVNQAQRVMGLINEFGIKDAADIAGLKTDQRRRLESARASLSLTALDAIKGTPSDKDAERIDQQTGSLEGMIGLLTNGEAGVREFERGITSGVDAYAGQYGYRGSAASRGPKGARVVGR